MLHNAIVRLILWGRKSGLALDPVELSGGITAARLAADPDDPARVALLHHISASRGAYEYERRGGALYVYAAADYTAIQRRGACIRAASDLFFAARRPDLYAADAAQRDADALPVLHVLASKAQTYADALQSAAYDLIDPEAAEDDGALFALHLSAVAAADRLANTIRNA